MTDFLNWFFPFKMPTKPISTWIEYAASLIVASVVLTGNMLTLWCWIRVIRWALA